MFLVKKQETKIHEFDSSSFRQNLYPPNVTRVHLMAHQNAF